MVGIAKCGQRVTVVAKVGANLLWRVRSIWIHKKEVRIVFIAFAETLNNGSISAGHWTIAAEKNQDRYFAIRTGKGIKRIALKINGSVLGPSDVAKKARDNDS